MATPMFIVTGFLDSGKTTMIKDTLMEQEWIEPGLTLLLLCEEGEEEYPEEYLKEKNIMAVLKIEEFDQVEHCIFPKTVKETIIRHRLSSSTMECGSWRICFQSDTREVSNFREYTLP